MRARGPKAQKLKIGKFKIDVRAGGTSIFDDSKEDALKPA
jgi:hypothetical protein